MPWFLRMTMRISLLALPLYIYAGMRLSTAISTTFHFSKKKSHTIVFSAIFWFYIYPITIAGYHLLGNLGRLFIFDTQLHLQDYLFLFPFWWGFISLLEILPFFTALDIICLVSRLKIFPSRKKWLVWQSYLKIGIAFVLILYVGIRTYFDTTHIRITNSEVAIENLPEEFQGLSLCLIGDLHIDRYTQKNKLEKVEEIVHRGEEDLLLFTGDLVSYGKKYVKQALKVMCNPHQKVASVACMGDHDFWAAAREIPREMEECGWTFLQNQHHLIPYKGHQILVTGITHIYSWRISRFELKKFLANAPKADLKILLVHQPVEFLAKTAVEYGYHLMLAGHTHGGQIVHHIFGIPITTSQVETRFYSGIYSFHGLQVIVTNGIGFTLAPLRYHAPAEINKLIVVKKNKMLPHLVLHRGYPSFFF